MARIITSDSTDGWENHKSRRLWLLDDDDDDEDAEDNEWLWLLLRVRDKIMVYTTMEEVFRTLT